MVDAAYHARWRAKNPERVKQIAARWRARHPGQNLIESQADPERVRSYWRKRRGLPEPTRPRPGLCEMCGGPPNGHGKVLVLDHDHATEKFRGWICSKCNIGLGALGDSIEGIIRAAKYLRRALKESGKVNSQSGYVRTQMGNVLK